MNLEHFSENRYSEKILSPEGPSTLKTSFFKKFLCIGGLQKEFGEIFKKSIFWKILSPQDTSTCKTSFFGQVSKYRRPSE